MGNELERAMLSNQQMSFPLPLSQSGDKNTQIAYSDRVIINNYIYTPNPPTDNRVLLNFLSAVSNDYDKNQSSPSMPSDMDLNYYNLIVTGEEIKNGRTKILKSRSLTVESEIVRCLSDFSDESCKRLMTFPSLIMNENANYSGKANPEQRAYLGFLTDIRIPESDKYRIKFQTITEISQQAINEVADNLDILGNSGVTELNRTHWTVKNVNLIEELIEANLLISGVAI